MTADWSVRRKAFTIVGVWALINAVLVTLQFGFPGPTMFWRITEAYCSVGIIAVCALLALLLPRHRPATSPAERTAAPGAALAAACMIGGLAWVFGVYLVYLAVPLVAFALARWRAERHGGNPS